MITMRDRYRGEFLHHQRAPGMTCLSALGSGRPGTTDRPVNESKGCGGVMRVAPAGLAGGAPFTLGGQAAALTHGHPSGYLAAAAFAQMIGALVHGRGLPDAVGAAGSAVRAAADGDEVSEALAAAVAARVRPEVAGSRGTAIRAGGWDPSA